MGGVRGIIEYLFGNYVFLMSVAAVMLSATQVGIKLLSKRTCIFHVFCVRSFFVCVAMYLIVYIRQEKLFGERSKYGLLGLRTLAAALTFIAVHFSTHLIPLVDATFLCNSYPMTTALLAFSLGLETLSWKSWVGVIGCVLGNALILQPPFIFGGDDDEEWDAKRIVGVCLALFSTVLTGFTAIFTSMLGRSIGPYGTVFSAISAVFVISFPFVIFSVPEEADWTPNLGELGLHVLIVVTGIIFHPSFCRGYQIGPPTKSSIILLTNMLYSAVFGVLVLGDDASWYTLIGGILIIVSALIISYDKQSTKKVPTSQVPEQADEQEQLL